MRALTPYGVSSALNNFAGAQSHTQQSQGARLVDRVTGDAGLPMQTHGPAPEEQASFALTKPDEDIGPSDFDKEEPVE